eukprot:TRINITY_DN22518_c0_g1_i1.p1 TRINITY_DN22518_c0_g1~~TRINITY_DN22518_c0_g1_i1.p1  ORF type:complete len:277 (-),score=44.90 TRINITY_DN22518_c0_g1_i1:1090-1884(-)
MPENEFLSKRLGFIGVGTISSAVVTGLSGLEKPPKIVLCPRNEAKTKALAEQFPGNVTRLESNQEVVDNSDWVFVAVLTPQVQPVFSALKFREDQVIVSLVAASSVATITELAAPAKTVIKAIPIPPVAHRKGTSTFTPPHQGIEDLFNQLGTAVVAPDEAALSSLIVATCFMGAHYKFLHTITDWMVGNGVGTETAGKFVSSFFNSVAFDTQGVSNCEGFAKLVGEQTPGGLNEQNIARLTEAGAWEAMKGAAQKTYDAVAKK